MNKSKENIRSRDKQAGGNVFSETLRLVKFMKTMGVNRVHLVCSIFVCFLAIFLQALNIRFLMDLLRGMISRDFTFMGREPVTRQIIALLPETFQTSGAFFLLLIGTIFVLGLLKGVLQYLSDLWISYQVRYAASHLRGLIFSRYLLFGKLFYDRANLGRLNTILVKFSQAISIQLNSLQRLMGQLFSLIVYFVIMFFISWQLTLLTLCIFPPFVFLTQKIIVRFRSISRAHARSEEYLDNKIFSALSSIALIKAHNMEGEEKAAFKALNEEEARLSFKLDKKEKLIQPMQEFSMMIAFLILACAMMFFVPAENGRIAGYLVFFYLVRLSLPGFSAINQLRIALGRSGVRIDRIMDLLKDDEKFILTDGQKAFAGLERAIEFRGLNFNYTAAHPVLENISLSVEKGKVTAIVGPTGSGKTTLVHLLLRFYDCPPGTVFLDGKDIRDFTSQSLMRHLAYVSQDAIFFNDTIRMNMTYGLSRPASDEELSDAAKKSRLFDLIASLPERFDTKIGERGVQFSGGEKQRLSIARALLRRAEILILDEATSALDAKTEKFIQEAIHEAVKGRTTIVIAHRFSTIRHADKIIFLEKGRILEEGILSELLARKGRFYEHWNEQKFF